MQEVVQVVIISHIVARVVSLNILDECLEVEVWQLVHDGELDVLKELIIKLRCTGLDGQVSAMLWQAPVDHCVVLVVSVHDGGLQPLVWLVADEALPRLQVAWAVHLSVGAEMGAKGMVLAHSVLHEATSVVHVGVDHLSAGEAIVGKWGLRDVHDLVPCAEEVLLVKLGWERVHGVAHHLLGADW